MFNHYPELLLFDATYKLNNREMPLFIQSVVDGNGITEIVSLTVCKSESRVVVEFVLECFKKYNPNWDKVKCVIGDKDFADRVVYKEKFVGVVLQICLFHVLRTFNREITTVKRNITTAQRGIVLNILQSLCYSQSEDDYQKDYKKLCELNLEEVTEYYNTKDKFKNAAAVTKDINSLIASMATGEYTYYIAKLKQLRKEIVDTTAGIVNSDENSDHLQGK